MSGYSLEILNRHKHECEFEETLIYNLENYFYHLNFRVGEGVEDKNELKHTRYMYKIMRTDNCELINYIQAKIDGLLEDTIRVRPISETFAQYNNYYNNTNTFIIPHVYWEEAKW